MQAGLHTLPRKTREQSLLLTNPKVDPKSLGNGLLFYNLNAQKVLSSVKFVTFLTRLKPCGMPPPPPRDCLGSGHTGPSRPSSSPRAPSWALAGRFLSGAPIAHQTQTTEAHPSPSGLHSQSASGETFSPSRLQSATLCLTICTPCPTFSRIVDHSLPCGIFTDIYCLSVSPV